MNKIEELIEQLCPNGVEFKNIETLINNKSVSTITPPSKLTKNFYQTVGVFPIIDQGQNFIVGYTDNEEVIIDKGLYIIFGDHTEAFKYVDFAFAQGADGIKIIKTNHGLIIAKYLYYALNSYYIKTGKYTRHFSFLKKTFIPIPPLAIQQEIVNILDKFTELQAELQAELHARRAQYEYYRNELLDFEGKEVEWKPLGEVCDNIISGKNTLKANEGDYPVYGSTGIIGRSNLYVYENDCLLVARVGANAGFVYKAKGKYDVSDNTLIIRPKEIYNMSFAYFQLLNLGLNKFAVGGGQPLITAGLLKKLKIPLPPLAEQKRIVILLDKFDALVNGGDSGSGAGMTGSLPAEIEARHKQYEYYRGKLLDFKPIAH